VAGNPLLDISVERRARAIAPTEMLATPARAEASQRVAPGELETLTEAPLSMRNAPISATRRPTAPPARDARLHPARRPAGAAASIIAAVAFFAALALPTADATPWALILYPTGVGFHALVMLLMLMAVGLSGLTDKSARIAYSVAGFIGLLLAWLVMRDSVAADVFDGQPAIFALWQGGGVAGGALALGVACLAAGAFARMNGPRSTAPAVWVGLGFVAIVTSILTAGAVDGAAPIGSLFESFAKTAFVGDRVAAFALVPAIILAAPFLLVFKKNSLASAGAVLAVGVVLAWALPILVLALFVSSAAAWTQVLAPLKATFFLVGAVTLAAMAGGRWARPGA